MTTLLSQNAIQELRDMLSKEINPKRVEEMTDEDISTIGFFMLEIYRMGLVKRRL